MAFNILKKAREVDPDGVYKVLNPPVLIMRRHLIRILADEKNCFVNSEIGD